MRKNLTVLALAAALGVVLACSQSDVTGPTTPTQTVTQQAPAPAVVAPTPAATPTPVPDVSNRGIGAEISGTTATIHSDAYHPTSATYCAFELLNGNFNTQALLGSKTISFQAGGSATVALADVYSTCGKKSLQIDVIRGEQCGSAPNGAPDIILAHAFAPYDNEGVWNAQTPVHENVGQWGSCQAAQASARSESQTCHGTQSRTFDLVTYEVNSCSQERREKTRVHSTESQNCDYAASVSWSSSLKLTADPHDPGFGLKSLFNYHIKKDVPGNNDPSIWDGRLAAGESVTVDVPNDHTGYYGQYDSENNSKTNVVHADCPEHGPGLLWRPSLELVCKATYSCKAD